MMDDNRKFCVTAWQNRCINSDCPNYMTREFADTQELPALVIQMKTEDCGFIPVQEED